MPEPDEVRYILDEISLDVNSRLICTGERPTRIEMTPFLHARFLNAIREQTGLTTAELLIDGVPVVVSVDANLLRREPDDAWRVCAEAEAPRGQRAAGNCQRNSATRNDFRRFTTP